MEGGEERAGGAYHEGLKRGALEGVDQPHHLPIGRNKDEFAVGTELESGPVAVLVLLQLERSKGTLKSDNNTLRERRATSGEAKEHSPCQRSADRRVSGTRS